MAKMVRKQFYITEDQDARLKRLAAEQGLTEAELVRIALDQLAEVTYMQSTESTSGRIRETAVMERYSAEDTGDRTGLALSQKLADAAWQRELAFMKSLGKDNAGERQAEAWKFNREELYEEREDRIAKILRRY